MSLIFDLFHLVGDNNPIKLRELSCKSLIYSPFNLAVTCPRLSPPSNGELLGCNTTELLYKTVCRLSCNDGFEAIGSMVRRCKENGTWTGTDLVCEGIYTNGLTLKPAGREPNALLEIFGKIIDLPMPSNLKNKTIFVLNDTNVACLTSPDQVFH